MNRTIILALGLAVVLLAATASTASAAPVVYQWECPVPSTPPTTLEQIPGCLGGFAGPGRTFDFGDRQVGTTSLPQRFALGVSSDTFTPSISVSGDYAQTNNCPPTLSAPEGQIQGCLIAVTFAPTDTGRKEGTLSTGRGGPTVALTGNGVKHRTAPGPLKLETRVEQPSTRKMRKVRISATSNYDSKVVASGDVKRTTKQLKGGKEAVIETKLKRPGRLLRSPEACLPARFCHRGAKIKVRATDEFGQTDTEFHRYYQR
jgi:hypothetical protein